MRPKFANFCKPEQVSTRERQNVITDPGHGGWQGSGQGVEKLED